MMRDRVLAAVAFLAAVGLVPIAAAAQGRTYAMKSILAGQRAQEKAKDGK